MSKIFTYLPMVAVLLTYNCAAEQAPQAGPPTIQCQFSPKGTKVLKTLAGFLTLYSDRFKNHHEESGDFANMSALVGVIQNRQDMCEKK